MILVCPDCGAEMTLKENRYGKFYGCVRFPSCKAAHGASPNGNPLGVPADKETRELRIKAHICFDSLWKDPRALMTRAQAYKWLQVKMRLRPRDAHIGRFSKDQCLKLIDLTADYWSHRKC